MKQLDGWLTLSFAGCSALLMAATLLLDLRYAGGLSPTIITAALCWGVGYAWFVRLGRISRGRARKLFSVAFYLLCADLVLCLGLSLFFLIA